MEWAPFSFPLFNYKRSVKKRVNWIKEKGKTRAHSLRSSIPFFCFVRTEGVRHSFVPHSFLTLPSLTQHANGNERTEVREARVPMLGELCVLFN